MYGRRHGKNRGENEETMVTNRDIGLQDSQMEVDMADKEILGIVDAVVTKQSTESNIYVPPGDIVFSGNIVFQEQIKSNFLWEMYGRRHGKNRGENAETMVPDRDIGLQDSHMEVDKAEKEILGTVDAVVTKQSTESNIYVPPRFSAFVTKQSYFIGTIIALN
ncbi:hypothetical protein POM88_000334 [Heracleum sosnowskyi]|uniref:Uncharacterized protein n=1 Tax=Heracleum sosnowskyi TaxID=360622 RepID=A0AAD8N8L3_9APIA|nr:hypothetical protein POM88_000334 [Heracleum sosnowskyi]